MMKILIPVLIVDFIAAGGSPKGDATATPHVGPPAQDFHAAFGLGTDERPIATVDADDVALAAIQGLNQKVEGQAAELKAKHHEIQELKAARAELTQLVAGLTLQTQTRSR